MLMTSSSTVDGTCTSQIANGTGKRRYQGPLYHDPFVELDLVLCVLAHTRSQCLESNQGLE